MMGGARAKALEEKMKSMREQQEKAKLEMQQWEKHLEEKESSMLARSDKTLRNRTWCSSAERENLNDCPFSSYHENVKCITHSYHKRITRITTLKYTLK